MKGILEQKKLRNFKLTNRLYHTIKWIADKKGRPVIQVVIDALEDYIAKYGAKNKMPDDKELEKL